MSGKSDSRPNSKSDIPDKRFAESKSAKKKTISNLHTPAKDAQNKIIAPSKLKSLGNRNSMSLDAITVNIETLMGNSFSIKTFRTERVKHLKDRIAIERNLGTSSQSLIFQDTALSDDSLLGELGIMDGPGAPPSVQRPDFKSKLVFLLCKNNDELFVLEVHLDGDKRLQTVLKHNLTLRNQGDHRKILECMGSNDCFDISDICDIPSDSIPEEIAAEMEPSEKDWRPSSGDSVSSIQSKLTSRPQSSDSFSSLNSQSPELKSLFWDKDWLFSEGPPSRTSGSQRPATAISIMQLPTNGHTFTFPAARPATANQILERLKTQLGDTNEKTEINPEPFIADIDLSGSKQESKFRYENKKKTPSAISDTADNLEFYCEQKNSKQVISFTSKCQINPRDGIKNSQRNNKTQQLRTPGRLEVGVKKIVCQECNRRLGPAQVFLCKCNLKYCAEHRYSDRHRCSHDYRKEGQKLLLKSNPLIKKDKCIKL